MNKKVFSIMFVVFAAVFAIFSNPAKVMADNVDSSTGLSYTVDVSGNVTITGYDRRSNTVDIPYKIAGKNVTSIGDYAFDNCGGLTSVTISNSSTTIGNNAFDGCNLHNVITYLNTSGNNVKNYSWINNVTVSSTSPQAIATVEAAADTLTPTAGASNVITLNVKDSAGNFQNSATQTVFNSDWAFNTTTTVAISGVIPTQDGSYGSIVYDDGNGEKTLQLNSNSASASGQEFKLKFTDGQAKFKLVLSNAARQNIELSVYGVTNPKAPILNMISKASIPVPIVTPTQSGGSGGSGGEDKLSSDGFKNIVRLGGQDRFETAVKIDDKIGAKEGTPIVIVSGENYPDAISVSSIAAQNGYPILITPKDKVPDEVKKEISTLKPSKVYIIGLEGVINKDVENQISSMTSLDKKDIVRIGGKDRFETSLDVAKYFGLSGSIYAAKNKAHVILVGDKLSDGEIEYLKNSKLSGITILGEVQV